MTTLEVDADTLIRAARDMHDKRMNASPRLQASTIARRLTDHFEDLATPHHFRPGDLVVAKAGLTSHLKYPARGEPAVVTKVLKEPLRDTSCGNGEPSFGMKFDIALLVMGPEDTVLEFHYDSRYFEPYQGDVD